MDPLVLRLLLSAKQQDVAALRQLHSLIEVVTCIGDLVHQLQRERGLSNMLMYTPQPALSSALQQQQGEVSSRLTQTAALTAELLAAGALQAPRLQSALACALQQSQILAQVRLAVAGCQAQQECSLAPCEQYSQLIRHWLDVVIEAAGLSVSPAVSQLVLSLIYLLQAKEFAGQERAWGVVAFSGKANGIELAERLQVLAQSQQDALQALWPGLSSAVCQVYQPHFCQQADPQYLQLKDMMLGLCRHQQASPALAELWFQCASRRIDLLHALLEPLKQALEQQLAASKQTYAKEQQLLKQQGAPVPDAAPLQAAQRLAGIWPHCIVQNELSGQASLLQLLREQSQHIGNIETELEQARSAVQELKMVQRAKLMLIAQHQISEQQAHHQLQKLAMDRQQSLFEVAALFIEKTQMRPSEIKKSAKSS
jgi:hypothetical protein